MKTALILAALLAGTARAQQEKAEPAGHEAAEDKARTVEGGASIGVKACHEDIDKYCGEIKPGNGRIGACLKKKSKKLSSRCRRWLWHGGPGHVERAFQEIDAAQATAKRPAEKPQE